MQEMQVQSLGQEDPLEKEMATHSSILAWEVLWTWTEEPGRLQFIGSQRVGHDLGTKQQQDRNVLFQQGNWLSSLTSGELCQKLTSRVLVTFWMSVSQPRAIAQWLDPGNSVCKG